MLLRSYMICVIHNSLLSDKTVDLKPTTYLMCDRIGCIGSIELLLLRIIGEEQRKSESF